jgi:CRISPR-associated protein Csd2
MTLRRLLVFRHESRLGNASASSLFDRVVVKKRPGADAPRAFADYEVTIDVSVERPMPAGIALLEWTGQALTPPLAVTC